MCLGFIKILKNYILKGVFVKFQNIYLLIYFILFFGAFFVMVGFGLSRDVGYCFNYYKNLILFI